MVRRWRSEGERTCAAIGSPKARRQVVRFADLANLVLLDYRLQERRSIRTAEAGLGNLRAVFGDDEASSITYERLVEYATRRLTAGKARATVRKDLALLKRGFNLARRAGQVRLVPPFPTISVDNARQGFVERTTFEAIRSALPEVLADLITLLYVSGWRVSEGLGLTWPRVDFQAGTMRLEPGTTKNRRGRTFPFAVMPELREVLERRRTVTCAATPWVFHRNGKPIRDFRIAWSKATTLAGCEGILVHDLRRSAVRNLERAGVPRSVAMKLTGHVTEHVYARYAITADSDLEDGIRKLAGLLANDRARSSQMPLPLTPRLTRKGARE